MVISSLIVLLVVLALVLACLDKIQAAVVVLAVVELITHVPMPLH